MIGKGSIQNLKHGITIYPRDYFYPLSYDRQNNIFTENTCMIHYYDASWVPKGQQRENKIYRIFGKKGAPKVIEFLRKTKRTIKNILRVILFPITIYRNNKRRKANYNEKMNLINEGIKNIKPNDVLTIYNILEKKPRLIIFSAFELSWCKLLEKIKEVNPEQRIKILWHGSNAMNIEEYDWNTLRTILEYSKYNVIESIGFVKKSMYEFYKFKNFNCEFVMNTVQLDKKMYCNTERKDENIKIGIYASGDNYWC